MSAGTATVEAVADTPPMVSVEQCQEAAEEWEARFAEDAENARREPDLKQVSRTLASVRDERLAVCPNLHAELRAAKREVAAHGGYGTLVKALHISRTALVEAGGLGLLRITIEGRYFTPNYEAETGSQIALIVPVWDGQGGDLVDLLAIRMNRPGRFWVRSGFAQCLGAWNIAEVLHRTTLWELPGEVHPSLVLAPNPLQWLQSDCQGACILHKGWLSHSLAGIRAVTAYDESHAKALHKLLTCPGAPKIYLREKREAA